MPRWFDDISPERAKVKDYHRYAFFAFNQRIACRIGMYCSVIDLLRLLSWIITLVTLAVSKRVFLGILVILAIILVASLRIWTLYRNAHYRDVDLIKRNSFLSFFTAIICYIISRFTEQRQFLNPGLCSGALMMLLLTYLLSILYLYFGSRGIVSYSIRILCLFLWGYFACRISHKCYQESQCIQGIVGCFHRKVFPYSGSTFSSGSDWLSLGSMFFAGCLIIISWSKDRPCGFWNPFSAQELGMESGILDIAIVLLSALLYSVYSQLDRLTFYLTIGMLATDVYSLFLCNSQHIDSTVRRKIIQNMDVLAIAKKIQNAQQTGIGSWSGKETHCADYDKVHNDIIAYALTVAEISRTCFSSNRRTINKAHDIVFLASDISDTILDFDSNTVYTLGFAFGMSCIPYSLHHAASTEKIREYKDQIHQMLHSQSIKQEFCEMISCGLEYAIGQIEKLTGKRATHNTNPMDRVQNKKPEQKLTEEFSLSNKAESYYELRTVSEGQTGKFLTWIASGTDRETHKEWKWAEDLIEILFKDDGSCPARNSSNEKENSEFKEQKNEGTDKFEAGREE